MSYALNVHLQLGETSDSKINQLVKVLDCLSLFDLPSETDKPFLRFAYGEVLTQSCTKVAKVQLNTNSPQRVGCLLNNFWDEQHSISIKSVYPCSLYDNDLDRAVESVTPLDIILYGNKYENGYYCERYGDLLLVFDNVNTFSMPHLLAKQAGKAAIFADKLRYNSICANLKSNYEAVIEALTLIIEALNPQHLITCTGDTEVNPLVAHEIYHKDIQDFARDLYKIAYLHERGGAYFLTDVTPSVSLPAWKRLFNYGYLRKSQKKTAKRFIEQVQLLANKMLEEKNGFYLFNEDIESCLQELPDIKASKMGTSYLVSANGSPFSYIESLYFSLLTKAIAN